jgi:hypothetical protein
MRKLLILNETMGRADALDCPLLNGADTSTDKFPYEHVRFD